MKTSVCKYCDQPIGWIMSETGYWRPVDPELKRLDQCKPGKAAITKEGFIVYAEAFGTDDLPVYQCHFATCTNLPPKL